MADPVRIELKDIELFGKQLCTLKQDFFDAIHPIGEVYTQYPQQDDPMTLYNKNGITSVWEEQLQYNGAFFRSSNALNVVWKIDGESNYYTIDNTNKVTPVKVKADTGGAINIASSSSGHTKTIGGKTYKDYAVTGYSTAAAAYINKTNNLNIQGNTIKETSVSVSGASHSHGGYTGYTQPSFKGTEVTSGGASTETVTITDPGHSHKLYTGASGGGGDHHVQINANAGTVTWKSGFVESSTTGITATHAHTHKVTASGTVENHRHSITSSGNLSMSGTIGSGNTETRPDNYSYIIWKRIS